jgi:hypothetical protein
LKRLFNIGRGGFVKRGRILHADLDVDSQSKYIFCTYRKGQPRIHVDVCRRCKEDCPERRSLPIIRIPKFYEEDSINEELKE